MHSSMEAQPCEAAATDVPHIEHKRPTSYIRNKEPERIFAFDHPMDEADQMRELLSADLLSEM